MCRVICPRSESSILGQAIRYLVSRRLLLVRESLISRAFECQQQTPLPFGAKPMSQTNPLTPSPFPREFGESLKECSFNSSEFPGRGEQNNEGQYSARTLGKKPAVLCCRKSGLGNVTQFRFVALAVSVFPRAHVALVTCCFALLCSFVVCGSVVAQNDSTESSVKKKPKIEFLECKVRVTDPGGNPVEDATVYCTGLRTRQERGSHWIWSEQQFGMPAPRVQTDANGGVEMQYPKFVAEKLETGWMTWSVDHPDFISFREDRDVTDAPAEIQLKRGFRVALTAKNKKTGQPIKEDLYAVIGLRGTAKWQLKKSGMLVSGVYPKRKCYLRVMQLAEGKPALFSEMLTIEPGEKSRVLLRDIELFPGARLEGKLDESIARPILNGYVAGKINIQLSPGDWETHWSWADKAEIKEDGTFVFESLPPGSVWQMIPICDGWVPGEPSIESIAEHFPAEAEQFQNRLSTRSMPQLVKLDNDQASVVLKMKPAASVTFKIVDSDGQPVEAAKAYMSPNQISFNGGSTILGRAYSTRNALLKTRRGEKIKWEPFNRFGGESDKTGLVVVNNLPSGNADVGVFHEEFQLPIIDGSRGYAFELKNGEHKEITIKLQPKGKGPKLGEEVAEEFDVEAAIEGLLTSLQGMMNWVL